MVPICWPAVISLKLRGHTPQEMAIKGSEQMKFAFGENPKRNYGNRKQMPMTRMGIAAILRETLYNAKIYSDALLAAKDDPSKAPKPDFKLDALVPVVRGQMRCRMHAHRSDDILTAISIAEEYVKKNHEIDVTYISNSKLLPMLEVPDQCLKIIQNYLA